MIKNINGLPEKLDQLESRLQTLIEGRFARLLPTRTFQDDLEQRLVAAMRSGVEVLPEGAVIAPDTYILLVHPDIAFRLNSLDKIFSELSQIIQDVGEKTGMIFLKPPEVILASSSNLDLEVIQVMAKISLDNLGETVEIKTISNEEPSNIPRNAFLIVNGTETFPLNKTIINIGRQSDNDLVIDDRRVSRIHAQLRAVRGKYVISDLGSTDGTRVNNQRITQRVLYSQDIISLAGVPLVYAQDEERSRQTKEINLSPSAQDSEKKISEGNGRFEEI